MLKIKLHTHINENLPSLVDIYLLHLLLPDYQHSNSNFSTSEVMT